MYYANSAGQLLSSHCALTGLVAEHVVRTLYPRNAPWVQAALYAGFSHDIAKIDPEFVAHLASGQAVEEDDDGTHIADDAERFSFRTYPRHNELSWALLRLWFDLTPALDGHIARAVAYAAYWHHARPLRSPEEQKNFATLRGLHERSGQWMAAAGPTLQALWTEIHAKAGRPVQFSPRADMASAEELAVPSFKGEYGNGRLQDPQRRQQAVQVEAMLSVVRSAVVTADRIVSTLSAEDLEQTLAAFESAGALHQLVGEDRCERIREQIAAMAVRFEADPANAARNAQQAAAVDELAERRVAVLQGPAGCGKTKIVLQCLQRTAARRVVLVVPRAAVGLGLFDELVREYGVDDGVELFTGDVKRLARAGTVAPTAESEWFTGGLVITTIDQVCSIALSHRRIDLLTELAHATLVFDEFHELFELPGIAPLFLELMQMRAELDAARGAHTLLVSATPNPFFLEQLSLRPHQVVRVASFNDKPFVLKLRATPASSDGHPFETLGDPGDILISNSATAAQRSACAALARGQTVLCYHSRFTPAHKDEVHRAVMSAFGRHATAPAPALYAGPIVQASLNISTGRLHTEACAAESWLQRLGRANRFGLLAEAEVFTWARVHEKTGALQCDNRALQVLFQAGRAAAWLAYLAAHCPDGTTHTLNALYALYARFHEQRQTRVAYEQDFTHIMYASEAMFASGAFDPLRYPSSTRGADRARLPARSLRGPSHYALPWHVQLAADGSEVAPGQWLWGADSPTAELLTLGNDELQGLDDSARGRLQDYLRRPPLGAEQAVAQLPATMRALMKGRRAPRLEVWQQYARCRDYPVLLTLPGGGRDKSVDYLYVTVNGVRIGLMRRRRLEWNLDL